MEANANRLVLGSTHTSIALYKSAYVMAHKIRQAMCADAKDRMAAGTVEVDGAYFGGYVKPANKANRVDRRLAQHQTGKRKVVVVMRERGRGLTLPFVAKSEAAAVHAIGKRVALGSTIHADDAAGLDVLHQRFLTKRINHQDAYSDGEACTNQAESFFSRIRRAEIGIHHHITGPYLAAYAGEIAWREDNRRVSNGEQYLMAANAALTHPVSRVWKGYWQRAISA